MTLDARELETRVWGFLRDELGVNHLHLDPESSLIESGLVDSVGLVRLATFLERALGIRIPDRDIRAEHFDTLRRIESYLRTRLG